MKEVKEKKKFRIYPFFLGMALISFIAYLIIEIMNYTSFLNFIPKLLGIIVIFLFLICFIIISFKNKEKRKITVVVGSLLIILYSVFNCLLTLNIINLPNDEYIPNFYNQPLTVINEWKEKNNIEIIENYEYNDKIKKYYVIAQDKNYPTLSKDIEELTLTISLGPDYNKEIIVPNFIGLNYQDVLKYAEENYLNNVSFEFVPSANQLDTIISQDGSGTRKRSDKILFTVATNEENKETNIIDFKGKSLLYAQTWLARNGFKVDIKYDYSEKIDKDYVIDQSVINETKDPEVDTITLTVSKGKMIVAPDINNMSTEEINEWIMENGIKVKYNEIYDDNTALGDVVSSSIKKDDVVGVGTEIEITISKGNLEMIKVNNINEFVNWAETNKIDYQINYEYSNTIPKDAIIKTSHQIGEKIKIDDTVIITVSKGKSISIPNFIGMSKKAIQEKCSNINLSCSFKKGGLTENTKADIAISQSKKANTIVSEGTSLIITVSSGIIEKVNIPSFKNKTKSEIQSSCKSLGITCNFKYQSGYSSVNKDVCISQSKEGTINKGSSITITLSNGPAKTYTIIIDANQLSSGNPTATKNTLESKLKNACPGVNFNFKFEKANSGIGYLSPNSEVKVGSNKLVQGKTYNVIINSN